MKISGPVSVPPMIPMTTSKRGRSSAMRTADQTSTDRMTQRLREKSGKNGKRRKIYWVRKFDKGHSSQNRAIFPKFGFKNNLVPCPN